MHLADGSVQYGSILAIYIYKITIDHSVAGNTTVRRSFIGFQIEIRSSCGYKSADFNETVVIE